MSDKEAEYSSSRAWNSGPIHLTKERIRLPGEVLQEFFQLYSLPEIRSLVKLIFHLASTDSNISNHQTSLLKNQLIKLIEAAWLLNTSTEERKEK